LGSDYINPKPPATDTHPDTTIVDIYASLYKLFTFLPQLHSIMGLEDRASAMIGISAAFLGIAWIAFSMRVVVKGYIMRSFTLDDWLMLITMVRVEDRISRS
jgi:uncharacterized protein with PQ loop repeat